MGNRRFAIAYAFLVGVPLLGLMAILKVGCEATAPIALGGAWDVQVDLRALEGSQCAPLPTSGQPVLSISQSGKHLAIALDRMQGNGSVENAQVNATLSSGDVSCGMREGRVQLLGDVGRSAGDEQITGIIETSGCVDCAKLSFLATRRPASLNVGP